MSRRLKGLLLAVGLTAACSTLPRTPAQIVYAIKSEYAADLAIAAAYHDLPTCPSAPMLCKDPTTMVRIQAAALAANATLKVAEDAVRGGGSNASAVKIAGDAVLSLSAITAALKVK